MLNVYQQLPADKKEKILEAVIREFAEHAYEKASTNRIVQEAGISKGLLFHYFGSKKNMYLETFDYCIEEYSREILVDVNDLPSDLFERVLYIGELKHRYFLKNPLSYAFIITAYKDILKKFPNEAEKRISELVRLNMPLILDGIDHSRFRHSVDIKKVYEYLILSFSSLSQRFIDEVLQQPDKGLHQYNEVFKQVRELVEIFKHGVYRDE